MGHVAIEDVAALVTQFQKANKLEWDERVRYSEERIYGWKGIAAEVERLKGVPISVKTIRRWWKTRRFPLDIDAIGVSVTRYELDRWLRSRPLEPGKDSGSES